MRKIQCFTKIVSAITETSSRLIEINCQLASLTRLGEYKDALQLFAKVRRQFLNPDQYTISTSLTAAAHLRDVVFGGQIHSYAIKSSLISHSHVSNTLLSLYAKSQDSGSLKKAFEEMTDPDVYSWTTLLNACAKLGDVGYASEQFDEMPNRDDVAVWNAMITGCVENGCDEIGIGLFQEMHKMGIRHDNYSFASVLSVCSYGFVDFGKQVHSLVIKTGFLAKPSVVNSLITMYFKCEDLPGARLVFEGADDSVRDQITFNVMIDGVVTSGREDEAILMFRQMLEARLKPNELTFVSLMSSCSCVAIGLQIHAQAIKTGYEGSTCVSNSAITMYSSFRDLKGAFRVFRALEKKDLVSWNTMISCYAQGRLGESAILVYKEMQRVGINPDEFTFGSLLVSSELIETAEMIRVGVYKYGLVSKIEVSNALISAYSKHGKIEEAYQIFHVSPKNLISWNTLVSGFLLNGFPLLGLEQFSNLLKSKLRPNAYTLSIVLSICTNISSLRLGKEIHTYILRHGHTSETSLGNALITMYSKCGVLHWSLKVFGQMTRKDVVSWNSLISAYAQHGEGEKAVLAFKSMQDDEEKVKPDQATFTSVLSACSHTGLVHEGVRIFNTMVKDYGFTHNVDHLSCVVDLLARAGFLDDAENVIINSQKIKDQSDMWWALFSACAAHGNLKLGRTIAGFLLEQEKDNPSVYVLLSNIYACAGQWKEAEEIRESMKRVGATKQRGCSWIRL